mgnify:CR=1 FL=1
MRQARAALSRGANYGEDGRNGSRSTTFCGASPQGDWEGEQGGALASRLTRKAPRRRSSTSALCSRLFSFLIHAEYTLPLPLLDASTSLGNSQSPTAYPIDHKEDPLSIPMSQSVRKKRGKQRGAGRAQWQKVTQSTLITAGRAEFVSKHRTPI